MKKIISVVLAMLILATFAGCVNEGTPADTTANTTANTTADNTVVEPETLKFGYGIDAKYGEVISADGEVNGSGEVVVNVATVLVDGEGKIVKCEIDTADFTVEYTSAGEAVASGEFLTKYELGDNYNMKAYGGSALEWFEQADAFEKVCVGKTVDEVKALLVDGYKGNDEVVAAGCTIGIAEFVTAVEKAVSNAVDSTATADSTLGIGVVSSADVVNATEDAEGSVELEINVAFAATDADSKVVAMFTDVISVAFGFTAKGEATTDAAAAIATKYELGEAYGMKAYGGAAKEWFEQADAFNAECLGKTADEIAALVVEGKGNDDLQAAGCTIYIGSVASAAVKAAQ